MSRLARIKTLTSIYNFLKTGIREDELDPFDVFVEEVRNGNWLVFRVREKNQPVAVLVSDISPLKVSDIALFLFVVVDRSRRGQGLFKQLIDASSQKLKEFNPYFLGMLAEMDTSDYGVSAEHRRRIFRIHGFRQVGIKFPYVVPPLFDGGEPIEELIPMFWLRPDVKYPYLPVQKLMDFFRIYFSWVDEFNDPIGRCIRDELIMNLIVGPKNIPLI
ncbi:MAG: hypothetical protein Q8N56_02820 [bacterium]|nr:hypothetical protein [bacterium]